MNKRTILALAMAVTIATPPLAAQNIVVSSGVYDNFVTEVSRELDIQLDRIRPAPRWEPSGIAQVRFRTGSDGRAHDISTYRRSGDGRLDREAIRAVERLTSLASQPELVKPGRMVQVNIIVASTRSQFDRLSKRLARDEAARIASSPREKAVLALSMAPQPLS